MFEYTFVGNYSILKALFYVMVSLIVNIFIYTASWIYILLNICFQYSLQTGIYIYIYILLYPSRSSYDTLCARWNMTVLDHIYFTYIT